MWTGGGVSAVDGSKLTETLGVDSAIAIVILLERVSVVRGSAVGQHRRIPLD
jgi:hypothetical protein